MCRGLSGEVVLSVPEIRDYRAINGELVRHLDLGVRSLRLTGANGQRLLVSGLAGPWTAVIEVVGDAGPELAAGMDAPGSRWSVGVRSRTEEPAGFGPGRLLVLGSSRPGLRICSTRGARHGGGIRRGPCRALPAWRGSHPDRSGRSSRGRETVGWTASHVRRSGSTSGRGRVAVDSSGWMLTGRRGRRRRRSCRDGVGVLGVQSLARPWIGFVIDILQ